MSTGHLLLPLRMSLSATDVGLFAADACLVLLLSASVVRLCRIGSAAEALMALIVISVTVVIVPVYWLSPLRWLNRWGWLASHAAMAAPVAAMCPWRAGGRWLEEVRSVVRSSWMALRAGVGEVPLGAAVLLCVLLTVTALCVPPRDVDSMVYHLPRAAFWLQNGTLMPNPGPWPNARQVFMPPNSSVVFCWIFAFLRSDVLTPCLSLAGELLLMMSVFLLALRMRESMRTAFCAALFAGSIPLVVRQACGTENDSLAAALCLVSVAFLLKEDRDIRFRDFMAGGLALGLAVGTKGTALLVLPGVGLIALCAAVRSRRSVAGVAKAICLFAAGVAPCSLFGFLQNALVVGHPLGSPWVQAMCSDPSAANMWANVVWVGQFLVSALTSPLDYFGKSTPERGISLLEWGLAFHALLVSAGVATFDRAIRQSSVGRWLLGAGLLSFLLCLLSVRNDIFILRLSLPALGLWLPCLVVLFRTGGGWLRLSARTVVVLALVVPSVALTAALWLGPIRGGSFAQYSRSRGGWRTGLVFWPRDDARYLDRICLGNVLDQAHVFDGPPMRIGVVGRSWTFPLFGSCLQHHLVQFTASNVCRENLSALMRAEGLDLLYLPGTAVEEEVDDQLPSRQVLKGLSMQSAAGYLLRSYPMDEMLHQTGDIAVLRCTELSRAVRHADPILILKRPDIRDEHKRFHR